MQIKTLLGEPRLNRLRIYTQMTNCISGSIAEIGVYKGGSALCIARHKAKQRKFYCFDTFEGMPPVNKEFDNHHKEKDFNDTDYSSIKEVLEKFQETKVFKGKFPEVNSEIIINEKFSMVHIDVDIYQSYKDCLEFFYPRMVSGGIMTFDDYNEKTCLGAKKAVDEFFQDKKESLIWMLSSQISIVKQ